MNDRTIMNHLQPLAAAPDTPRAGLTLAFQSALLPLAVAFALWAYCPAVSAQETDPVRLTPLVTTANGVPQPAATVGTDVDLVSGAQAARQQLTTLADMLSQTAGASLFAAGRTGASNSMFVRGANSDQVLFLVDGIRFSDANTNYGPFLGSWRIGAADRVEIARGPQSTLYGAEAVGGVVAVSASPGTGHPTEAISAEAGSFGTLQSSAQAQGVAPSGLAYDASLAAGATSNGRANNDFRSMNAVVRLDESLSPVVTVGATVRALGAKYGDPGDRFTNDPTANEREEDILTTAFAKARLSADYSAQLTAGAQYRRFDAFSFGSETIAEQKRGVLDGQATGKWGERNRATAGFDLESSHDRDSGFGAIDHGDRLIAGFANDEFRPIEDIFITAGLRADDYSTYGAVTTGRITVAALVPNHRFKLRASYGTGFNSPSFLDQYAVNPYFVGNPRVRPEHSRGWDAGCDAYWGKDANQTLSLTWFRTDYRDLIADDFTVFPATTLNLNRAATQGVEAAWKYQVSGAIHAQVSSTYLKAKDTTSHRPLLRRPRCSAAADLAGDVLPGWTVGAGCQFVGRRYDVDPVSFGTVEDPGYSAVRVYTRWQLTRRWAAHARVENALDRRYEPVNGYPALRRGVYGGLECGF
jgi:vitamin B12 transporter